MKFSEVQLPSNRKFGFFFSVVFAAISSYFFIQDSIELGLTLLLLAIVFSLITIIQADLLLPLNKMWMRLGALLGAIVSPIVLGVIFFLIFMPIGLLMRVFGRDELNLRKTQAQTYWKRRDPVEPSADSFKLQF